MAARKLTKEQVCLILERIISRLGAESTLLKKRDRQFYSGPESVIAEELKTAFEQAGLVYLSNWHFSRAQAAREGAVRIDDTYMARILNRMDLCASFLEVYNDPFEAEAAEQFVWSFASRKFAAAGAGRALTSICAAGKKRVYRVAELDEMATHQNYDTINDKCAAAELEVFRRDPERFQRRTSLIELRRLLRMAWQEAENTGNTDIAVEFFRRKEFYLLQRRNILRAAGKTLPLVCSLSFEERRRREALFVLAVPGRDPARPTYRPHRPDSGPATALPTSQDAAFSH